MIVLPTEALEEYIENPLVKRLYLTDVGFFPMAKHHARIRKEGIEEYIAILRGGMWTYLGKRKGVLFGKKSGILHSQWSTTSLLCL